MKILLLILSVYFLVESVPASSIRSKAGVDESRVCRVKRSCLDCLQQSHCTWCKETSECFSKELPDHADFCKENFIPYDDKGMSFEDNAKCACMADKLQADCTPPEEPDAPLCSNRGKCECGRCFCDPTPDANHPSKVILGRYCEFDNFSCDEPRCNEGPYHISNSTRNLIIEPQ